MIIFDTETTGLVGPKTMPLSKQPQIIEFAAIKLDDETLEEVDRIEFLVKNFKPLEKIIIKITGIKDSDLAKAEPFAAHYEKLVEFFLGERHIIAHNLRFDIDMLKMDLMRIDKVLAFPWPPNHICTVQASSPIKGRRMKLGELYEHLMGKEIEGWHRAMADVEALTSITKKLIQRKYITI